MRVHGIKNFKVGVTAYTTIKSVETNDQATPLYDAGDIDTNETLVGTGVSVNTFTITLSDPVQAEAIKSAAAGNITFEGIDASSASAVICTLTNAKVFGRQASNAHSAVAQITLTGRCDSVSYAEPQ